MTLAIREQYPNSLRLDFPNWGEVNGVVFAKGVISDVKIEQDEESGDLKVYSLVKVKVGEEEAESDFIPLFYHPKPKYWDNREHQATDFNQDGKYFEQAWMSFRVDDEVIVMMQEKKPIAVIGFADLKPRIGEDIVKFVVGNIQVFHQMSKDRPYGGEENGLDGKPLNLTEECPIFPIQGSGEIELSNKSTFKNSLMQAESGPEGQWAETYDIWNWAKAMGEWFNFAILVPVGPILYRVSFNVFKVSTYLKVLGKYTNEWGYWPEWHDLSKYPDMPGFLHYECDGLPPDGAEEIPWADIPNPPPAMPITSGKGWKAMSLYGVPVPPDYQTKSWYPDKIEISDPGELPLVSYSTAPGAIGPDKGALIPLVSAALYKEELADDPMAGEFKMVNKYPEGFFEKLVDLISDSDMAKQLKDDPDSLIQVYVHPHNPE